MALFVVEQRRLWGDYGRVLISGFIHREVQDAPLLLHRAGPFLPPISFPWSGTIGRRVIVSDGFRRDLVAKGFPGLEFRPAVKDHIVRLPWHEWDLSAGDPKAYPPGGEPGDYLMEKPHDAAVAAQMPVAWELLPPVVPMKLRKLSDPRGGYLDKYRTAEDCSDDTPMFTSSREWGCLIVGDATRTWLEERAADWVMFCDVESEGT